MAKNYSSFAALLALACFAQGVAAQVSSGTAFAVAQGGSAKYGHWTGERAVAAKDWDENSSAIVATIEKMLAEKKFSEAESLAWRYTAVSGGRMAPFLKIARVGKWRAELAKLGKDDHTGRIRILTELASLDPSNATYKREIDSAQKAIQAQQIKAFAGLSKQRDDVEKVTFYFSPSVPTRSVGNFWALYIGVPDNGAPYLRFKWMYTASTWLFIKGITLNVDGAKVDTPVWHFSVKRDNSGDRVWEWRDESVNDTTIPVFEKLAASKKTIIRYEGDKYHADRVLSDREKRAFVTILSAYRGLKNGKR